MTAAQQAEVWQVAFVGAALAAGWGLLWAANRIQHTQPLNRAAGLLAWPLRHWVRTYADVDGLAQLADAADRLTAEAEQAGDHEEAELMRLASHILTCTGDTP